MTVARIFLIAILGPVISMMDIRYRRIPNRLLCLFAAATTALYLAWPPGSAAAVRVTLVSALVLLPLFLAGSSSIGAGDIKLMILLALLLGNGGQVLTAFTVAALIACGELLFARIFRGKFPESIAFAPALMMGALFCV